jgi:hypothetical protein
MTTHVLDDMPAWLDRRHADLLTAACYCYDLRGQAERRGDMLRAADFNETGDVYFFRAQAISAEWD